MYRQEAIKMVLEAKLSRDQGQDLLEMYEEDAMEYSEHTALEKLENAIEDLK